jgi:hypothetical protein
MKSDHESHLIHEFTTEIGIQFLPQCGNKKSCSLYEARCLI